MTMFLCKVLPSDLRLWPTAMQYWKWPSRIKQDSIPSLSSCLKKKATWISMTRKQHTKCGHLPPLPLVGKGNTSHEETGNKTNTEDSCCQIASLDEELINEICLMCWIRSDWWELYSCSWMLKDNQAALYFRGLDTFWHSLKSLCVNCTSFPPFNLIKC